MPLTYASINADPRGPKAGIDEATGIPWFRGDLNPHEAAELGDIVRQAYQAGLKAGLEQAQKETPDAA